MILTYRSFHSKKRSDIYKESTYTLREAIVICSCQYYVGKKRYSQFKESILFKITELQTVSR
jgi:hypothetical protein